MNPLRLVRNSAAVLRLHRMQTKQWASTRTLPLDNVTRMRAQSALAGLQYRDGSTNPDTLTLAQAHDVMRWYQGCGL